MWGSENKLERPFQGESQTQQGGGNGLGYANAPTNPGLASRIQVLQKVVAEAAESAYQVRVALGIGSSATGQPAAPQTSLADVLAGMRITVEGITIDLREVLQHINS